MLIQKRWFVLFAIMFLTMTVGMFRSGNFVVTANAQTVEKKESVQLLTTEDIWKEIFSEVQNEAKELGLDLMSSSTDHIVNYHGNRFAITDDDYQVLLRIVQAEAGGEDIKGRMLVANVVLNRLEIGFGGSTISDVVFAKNQFAPVSDGRFFTVTVNDTTIQAVERVLNGEDHSKGALYFMCRPLASKQGIRWFDNNLKFLFKHGCHEFYTDYIERD